MTPEGPETPENPQFSPETGTGASPGAGPALSIDAIMASIRAGVTGGADTGAAADADVPAVVPPRATPSSPAARTASAVRPSSPGPAVSPPDGVTLEALVRAMLAPMLKEWLDAHLPEIVEAATHAEIRRLTGRGD